MGQDSLITSMSNMINNAYAVLNTSAQRLASGLRINSAADDASGLAVWDQLRAQMVEAEQSMRNLGDGASMVQTAEGAASQISDNLIQMKKLAMQASSGTLSDDQKALIQKEFDTLAAENVRIAETTEYNGIRLFAEGESIPISLGPGNTINVNTDAIAQITADLTNGSLSAMDTVNDAINQLSALRGGFGATLTQLEFANESAQNQAESILAAESRIADTDMAQEAVNMASAGVQAQMAIAVQAQANLFGDLVNTLIRE